MTSGRPWLPVGRLSFALSRYCHLCRGGHGQWGWQRGGVATVGTENLLLSRLSQAGTARLLPDPASLCRDVKRAQTLGMRVPAGLPGQPLLP